MRHRQGSNPPLAGALCLLLLLSGCASSPQVQYFTLRASDSPHQVINASKNVQFAPVHVPPTLDRKQVVRHTGPYTVDVSDQNRWSAPLDEMIRQVLTEDLMRMLPPSAVILPNEPANPSTNKIVVDILEFAPDASGNVNLDASWSLVPHDTQEPAENHLVHLSERATTDGATGQVSAMSAALDQLAGRIAQSLAAAGVHP